MAKNNVYLLYNFNSYHNRVLKKFDTLSEYINYQTTSSNHYDFIQNANFDYKDGVTASVTYNLTSGLDYDNSPNYVVVVDSNNNICSRWYVVDGNKTRGGQYLLTILRDGIADYYSSVIAAPCYIEKATLNASNPLIFNKENMSFNQIKSTDGEYLLKDETLTPWIVGYMAKQQDSETDTVITHHIVTRADIETTQYQSLNDFLLHYDENLATLWNYPNHAATTLDLSKWYYDVPFLMESSGNYGVFSVNVGNREASYKGQPATTPTSYGTFSRYYTTEEGVTKLNNTLGASEGTNLQYRITNYLVENQHLGNDVTQNFIDNLITDYNDKVVNIRYNDTDHYYKFNITRTGTAVPSAGYEIDYFSVDTTTAYAGVAMYAVFNHTYGFTLGTNFDNNFYLKNSEGYVYKYTFSYTEVSAPNADIKTTVPANRRPLDDAPYCMFAIPWNNLEFKVGVTTIDSTAVYNRAIASAIVEKMASKVYDLQLLPYCPFRNVIGANNDIDLRLDNTLLEGQDYSYIKDANNNTNIGIILWPHTSSDSFDITYVYNMPQDPIQIKIDNETKMFRICSPNYAAIYEFSPVKNGGVTKMNVDFTYKPYNPYIHVNPNFGGLYGDDWDDARGLICAGDFSLPQTTDQWAQFEINNKNYQNSFNRQIDTQDTIFKRQWGANWAGVVAGAASAGVSGAFTGSIAGGPAGAIAGGIIGGAASIGGGIADQIISKKNYETNKENTIAQFEMNLQNVQARPDTLSKVGAFNKNNKLWPFIEYYHATNEEEIAFRNKLKYNGMTVGVIDSISNYLQTDETYIKAQLIRLNINEDNHLVEHIANELNKGVYIK